MGGSFPFAVLGWTVSDPSPCNFVVLSNEILVCIFLLVHMFVKTMSVFCASNFAIYFVVRNEALRVAFIDEVETLKDAKVHKEFYSKLVKADINGKDKVQ